MDVNDWYFCVWFRILGNFVIDTMWCIVVESWSGLTGVATVACSLTDSLMVSVFTLGQVMISVLRSARGRGRPDSCMVMLASGRSTSELWLFTARYVTARVNGWIQQWVYWCTSWLARAEFCWMLEIWPESNWMAYLPMPVQVMQLSCANFQITTEYS